MTNQLKHYIQKFSNLRVDRARGIAPHKPILLLCVISLFQKYSMKENKIFLSPELCSTFSRYWQLLGYEPFTDNIAMPFFHLKGDCFWHLKPKVGFESVVKTKRLVSVRALREFVEYAYLDDELFYLLRDSNSRYALLSILVENWFANQDREVKQLLTSKNCYTNRSCESRSIAYQLSILPPQNHERIQMYS